MYGGSPLFFALALGVCVVLPCAAAAPRFLTVDPSATGGHGNVFGTIREAVDAALAAKNGENVVIELRGGVHRLDQTVKLTSDRLGGKRRLIFQAAEGAEPVISGGVEVGGWTVHDAEKSIWRATLAGPSPSRSLIVNGTRAVRARSVGGLTGPEVKETGYLAKNPEMAGWKNPDKIEFVYRAIWTNPRCRIASIVPEGGGVRIEMVQPGWKFCRDKGITSVKDPWYVENAYELLDAPGEWYLDETGVVGGEAWTLYYKPQPWEDMVVARVVLPLLENLFVFEGVPDKPVADVSFEGITFADTAWLRPSSERGHPDAQNNVIRENYKESVEFVGEGAALRFVNACGIEVRDCRFRHLGGIGILMTGGARDSRITGNSFIDIAANGIQIGDYLDWPKPASPNNPSVAEPGLQISGITIKNNYFRRCGVEYRSATAIALTFPIDCEISHNEIWHMPYSGFHIGWSWSRIDLSNTAGNIVSYNHIENVMVELADGAAIYTLGPSNSKDHPNKMNGNVIRRSRWGQAFYFDEGSSFYNLDNNATLEAVDFNIKVNGPTSHTIKSSRLYARQERNTVTDGARDIAIEPAIIVTDANRAEVEKLEAVAGLEKDYAHLRHVPHDPFVLEVEEGALTLPARTTSGIGTGVHGYEGMGYVEGIGGKAGAVVECAFEMTKPEERELCIRYSLTGEAKDGVELVVNGGPPVAINPGPTGDRSTWKTWKTKVLLREGANTLTLRDAAGKTDGLLVDRIELVPAAAP